MNVTHTDISGEIHGVKPSKLKLKTLQKRFENKTSLSSQEFLNYLDSWAKPMTPHSLRNKLVSKCDPNTSEAGRL